VATYNSILSRLLCSLLLALFLLVPHGIIQILRVIGELVYRPFERRVTMDEGREKVVLRCKGVPIMDQVVITACVEIAVLAAGLFILGSVLWAEWWLYMSPGFLQSV
jgi:4-hydroxybenzoate polyprenyltransferase